MVFLKVIIANINGSIGIEESESAAIITEIKNMGLELPVKVFSEMKLLEVLEDNPLEDFILFTNHPPNSSYPETDKEYKDLDNGSYSRQSSLADSYSKTHTFFTYITNKYNFKAIHFLTGAPKDMVSDKDLKSYSDTEITVTRRKDLLVKVSEYPGLYKQYILTKLQETIDS